MFFLMTAPMTFPLLPPKHTSLRSTWLHFIPRNTRQNKKIFWELKVWQRLQLQRYKRNRKENLYLGITSIEKRVTIQGNFREGVNINLPFLNFRKFYLIYFSAVFRYSRGRVKSVKKLAWPLSVLILRTNYNYAPPPSSAL